MATNIGPKIGIDGEAEYRKQINLIIQQAKTLASEMNAVTSAFTKNTTAEEKAKATGSVLQKQIETQRERVKALSEMLEKSKKETGENSIETAKWQEVVNKATAELNKMENEMAESTEEADGFGKSIEESGGKIGAFAEALASSMKTVAKVTGAALVAASTAIGALVKESVQGVAQYEQLADGVKTLFKESSDTIAQYAQNAWRTSGVSASEYMQQATDFSASLIQALEGDTAKAARLVDLAINDMADNYNKFGTDAQRVQDAYSGFARGQFTMLDNLKLGYGGTKAEMQRLLEDAEKLSGVEYDISSLADMISAIHVIQENLDITGTSAEEAAKTIEGSAAAMSAAWTNWIGGMADASQDAGQLTKNLGESISTFLSNIMPRIREALPRITEGLSSLGQTLISEVSPMLDELLPSLLDGATALINGVVQALPGILRTALNALPKVLQAGIQIMQSIIGGIKQALPYLSQAAQEIFTSLITYLQTNLPEMISTGLQALLSFSSGLREGAGELVNRGIELIQTLVNGLIEALPQLIETVPLIVSNIANIINDNAPKLLATAAELIVQLVKGLVGNIPVILANMPKIIAAIWDTISAVNWINLGSTLIEGFASGISSMWQFLKTTVQKILQHPISAIKETFGTFKTLGSNIIQFFSSGISGMVSTVFNAIGNIKNVIWDTIKSLISSAGSWGSDFVQGFASGIMGAISSVANAAKAIGTSISSRLHFSRPDIGPLRDYETWMPDFVKGMAAGLRENAYRLADAAEYLAGEIMIMPPDGWDPYGGNPSRPRYPSGGMPMSGIVVNVNGAPGQDVNELAEIVADKIETKIMQLAEVW